LPNISPKNFAENLRRRNLLAENLVPLQTPQTVATMTTSLRMKKTLHA
jgi:hypothetical protein